jgi:HlyD family secretion protein
VKVKILHADGFLRPEMNASVAFVSDAKPAGPGIGARPTLTIPASAIRNGSVFVIADGRAVKRAVKTGATTLRGITIEDGLIGGEDLISSPPADLKEGDRVKSK